MLFCLFLWRFFLFWWIFLRKRAKDRCKYCLVKFIFFLLFCWRTISLFLLFYRFQFWLQTWSRLFLFFDRVVKTRERSPITRDRIFQLITTSLNSFNNLIKFILTPFQRQTITSHRWILIGRIIIAFERYLYCSPTFIL